MTLAAARCDTHDMVVVHRVFRREFALLPRLVDNIDAGDVRQARLIAAHAREMISALEHHHRGEDALLWPRLRQRDACDPDLITCMEQQHEVIAAALTDTQLLLSRWLDTAARENTGPLTAALSRATTALDEHLDDEERLLLPVVAQHITQAEWDELGERGMASIPRSRRLIFLGYILQDATPRETGQFLQKVPAPARLAYRLIGARQYRREASRLLRKGPGPN